MNQGYKIFWQRTFYAFIILLVLIPIFALVYYANLPGRVIGLLFFILIAWFGVYEICIFMTKNLWTVMIFIWVLLIGTFLLPFNSFQTLFLNGLSTNTNLRGLIFYHFQWETFLVPLIAVILFILIDKNLRISWEKFLRNFFILIIVSYLSAFLAKGIWLINIFDWTKLIFVLSIAVVSDTFAYIGGSLFGKKWFNGAKLAPRISPSKSWAGAIIAFVITYAYASLTSYYIGFWSGVSSPLVLALVGGVILSIGAQLGDLLFSGFKRLLNIKDFSSLIPIHGGIFDRLDAISLVIFLTIIIFIFAI